MKCIARLAAVLTAMMVALLSVVALHVEGAEGSVHHTAASVEKPQGKYCGTAFKGQIGIDFEFVAPWEHAARSPENKPEASIFRSKVDAAISVPWLMKAIVSDESCSGVPIFLYVPAQNPEKQILYYSLGHSTCVTDTVYKYLTQFRLIDSLGADASHEAKAAAASAKLPIPYTRADWNPSEKTINLGGWGSIAPCGDASGV